MSNRSAILSDFMSLEINDGVRRNLLPVNRTGRLVQPVYPIIFQTNTGCIWMGLYWFRPHWILPRSISTMEMIYLTSFTCLLMLQLLGIIKNWKQNIKKCLWKNIWKKCAILPEANIFRLCLTAAAWRKNKSNKLPIKRRIISGWHANMYCGQIYGWHCRDFRKNY